MQIRFLPFRFEISQGKHLTSLTHTNPESLIENHWINGYRRLTPVRPTMWQAEAVKELTLSASPATAVGEQTLTLANRRYSTVVRGHFGFSNDV